jgi:hypothetical protein
MKTILTSLVLLLLTAALAAAFQDKPRRDPTIGLEPANTATMSLPPVPSTPHLALLGLVVAKDGRGVALLRVGEDLVRVRQGSQLRSREGWSATVEALDADGLRLVEENQAVHNLR